MRLFVALGLPAALRQRLSFMAGGLPGARWVSPENYHVTLRFIGELPGWRAEEVDAALAGLRSPPRGRPRWPVTMAAVALQRRGGRGSGELGLAGDQLVGVRLRRSRDEREQGGDGRERGGEAQSGLHAVPNDQGPFWSRRPGGCAGAGGLSRARRRARSPTGRGSRHGAARRSPRPRASHRTGHGAARGARDGGGIRVLRAHAARGDLVVGFGGT